MEYIKNKELFLKFNTALKDKNLIFIQASTGFGKTRFIEEALQGKNYNYFSLKNNYGFLEITHKIIVIDDFQYIINNESLLDQIINLSKSDVSLIISSRSNPKKYFMESIVNKKMLEIYERDLAFSEETINKLFSPFVKDKNLEDIIKSTKGNPLPTIYLIDMLRNGNEFNEDTLKEHYNYFFDHLKVAVFDYIELPVINFLVQMSVVDSFDIDLARAISMRDNAKILAARAIDYGSFMTLNDGIYRIRPEMLKALRAKSYLYYSYQEYNEFVFNAGHYYETIGDIKNALLMYKKCNSLLSIKRILVYNSSMNPSKGNFRFLRPFYEMLSEDDYNSNPRLMSGMCMLYALILDIEKSDYYYNMLIERAKSAKTAEYNEIMQCLAYLSVTLPHKGVDDLFSILGKELKQNVNFNALAKFTVTSDCPSIINGGKDFTQFLKSYQLVLEKYGDIIKKSMGETLAKGLISTIEAECQFTLGKDIFSVMQVLIKAKMETDKTIIDNMFVLARIEMLLAVERGDIEEALSIINTFIDNCKNSSNVHMLQNAIALRTFIYILIDDEKSINEWLKTTVDENSIFYTTDRIVYLIKVRCYMYYEKYFEAFMILQKLEYYANLYSRPYILAEVYILEAIIEYLVDKPYKDNLVKGLKICEERGLVRLLSFFGTILNEMLILEHKTIISAGISEKFLSELDPLLVNISNRYPTLFNKADALKPELSKTGIMVLQLQSQGYAINQIAERLNMNLETVRYHAKQNYKKLGASGKADAVAIAKKHGII